MQNIIEKKHVSNPVWQFCKSDIFFSRFFIDFNMHLIVVYDDSKCVIIEICLSIYLNYILSLFFSHFVLKIDYMPLYTQ
jgi:hypothetical protein